MDDQLQQILKSSGDPARGESALKLFTAAYHTTAGTEYDWSCPAAFYLMRIFGNSHALAERLITHPRWADQLSRDPFVATRKPRDVMERELAECLGEPFSSLRHFKYREMIRIVARELEGASPEQEILHEWSDLADVLVTAAYDIVHQRLTADHGTSCPGTIIALGKLGGFELNLSSDIDLLFIYERDTTSMDVLSPHEFHVRLAKQVTALLARQTEDGFVFRVDHDLRPEGPQGTLANSMDAAEHYYEYFGDDWERQALIRARPVAGDHELGDEFIRRIRPFVFRKTLGLEDLVNMRRMKERTKEEYRKDGAIDVKMGDGGIRAVEFLVQAMQMIYGGKIDTLRQPNTFLAIDELAEERLIHPTSARRLTDSYSFLRRVENMLQLVQEQQVHSVSPGKHSLTEIARRMGYDIQVFERDLHDHMSRVHRLFVGMFEADYERIELDEAIEENLASCTDDEERMDSIPWFKHQETRRIQHLDLEGKLILTNVLRRLTLVAEVVIENAWKMAWRRMTKRYGTPRTIHGSPATFAILGMGKLGSQEIDYGSDLDLCFIYSDAGRTDGTREVDNAEFFTRLAQRITSLISITSRYGRAYEVDSELRPSGRSGMLVTTLNAFLDHHRTRAEPWERMALMRARAIAGHSNFVRKLTDELDELAFTQQLPPDEDILEQEKRIRKKIDAELLRESDTRYDLKYGPGGIHDLEAVVHYHQLNNAHSMKHLRVQNTFKVVDTLQEEQLAQALHFYRLFLARVRLYSGHTTNLFDMNSSNAKPIAESMGFKDITSLSETLKRHRSTVSSEYQKIFG